MFAKLMKYDLKDMFKIIKYFYILIFAFAVISRLLTINPPSDFFKYIGDFVSGVVIGLSIGTIINDVIRSWVVFKDKLYMDQGYLTNTLPVSKSKIYMSLVLSQVITVMTSFLVIVAGLAICYYTKENFELFKQFIEMALVGTNLSTGAVVTGVVAIFFLEILSILVIGDLGIVLGYKQDSNKFVKAIGFGFGVYVLNIVLILFVFFVVGRCNPSVSSYIFKGQAVSNIGDVISQVGIAGIVSYAFFTFVYFLIGKYVLRKGVNLD